MIKKLFKWAVKIAVTGVLLLLIAVVALKLMFPPAKLKAMAKQYVTKNYQREIEFEEVSLTWLGFSVKNFTLSENTTLQDGTFIHANQLTAKVALKPLFKKRIEISTIEADGLAVNIVRQQDGNFNFDSLLTTPQTPTQETTQEIKEEDTPFVVTAQRINLTDCDIVYKDEQSGLRTALNDLNIEILRFSLDNPFAAFIGFTAGISGTQQPDMTIPVSVQLQPNLAGLDLEKASVAISQIQANYKTVQLNLTGNLTNFQNPTVELNGTISGLNNTVLAPFAPELPNFTLPDLQFILHATADLEQSTAHITQAQLSAQNSSLTSTGNIAWGENTPTYTLRAALVANLAQLVKMTDTLGNFSPAGTLQATLQATEKKNNTDVSGVITLKNISALYAPFTLTRVNGTITLKSLKNIVLNPLSGQLNGENFTASATYQNIQDVINMGLVLNLDKLVLKEFPASSTASATQNKSTSAQAPAVAQTSNPFKMNLQANVNIGGIEIPYVIGNGLRLNANLTDVTDTLAQTNGTVNFTLEPGKITNLDSVIQQSKTARLLLLPVSLINKAARILKIKLFSSTVEAATQGNIEFTQGEGQYTFTNGLLTVHKTAFNSAVTNVSASGMIDFKTEALDMKASGTFLTQATPVSFKVTGTLSNPKAKLDVVNTVGKVVGNLINGTTAKSVANTGADVTKGTANTAAGAVKGTVQTATDVVKGIGGLFKKQNKTKEETSQP